MKKINIEKILLNKHFLFWLPNLIYLAFFCYFYNSNVDLTGRSVDILFRDVFLLSSIYFFIFLLIHYILKFKIDYKIIFFIKVLLILLSFKIFFNLIFIVCSCIFIFIFFRISDSNKAKFIFVISYITIIVFCYNFFVAVVNNITLVKKIESYNSAIDFKISKDLDTPNIYWIHCDGMINFKNAEEYFDIDTNYINDYLKKESFYINSNASIVAAHKTMHSLVALYNPNYYDEFFNKYLLSLENYYDNNSHVSNIVSYDDLIKKRLNNELFDALYQKDYKIAAITDFDQYTSFYVDYMYDFYDIQEKELEELRFLDKNDNSYNDVLNYTNYSHLKSVATNTTIFHEINYNFIDYELIDYEDFDYSNFKYVGNTEFFKAKAILKSISHLKSLNSENLFTFIDFNITHYPWLYDIEGRKNDSVSSKKLESFGGNYEYSTYLLIEILNYIRTLDSDAVIVVQGDHGIHTFEKWFIEFSFNKKSDSFKELKNSTISAIYVPDKYKNGDEEYLMNPLNISRYLVNNFVGKNYDYLDIIKK